MAQYTYSFLRSEYDRIPLQLKKELTDIVDSGADEEIKQLMNAVCRAVEKAIADLARYAQDQLRIT